MTTKIIMVLDRSGSMSGLEDDVIGGFNSFVSEQKKLKDTATLTTVLFDDKYEILHDNIDLQEVKSITNKEYIVRGGLTALLDAIGKTIKRVGPHTNKKDNVLFIINTDGKENYSKEFNSEQIRDLVKRQEEKHGWKFVFLGANIDSFAEGRNMGINQNFNYQKTEIGIHNLYAAMSDTTTMYRNTRGAVMDTSKLKDLDKNTPV
jgi:uncharacterized protein YegL